MGGRDLLHVNGIELCVETFGSPDDPALLLLGGSSYGLYLVLTRDILSRHDPLRVISWTFVLAALTVLPIGARDAAHIVIDNEDPDAPKVIVSRI